MHVEEKYCCVLVPHGYVGYICGVVYLYRMAMLAIYVVKACSRSLFSAWSHTRIHEGTRKRIMARKVIC